MVAQTAVRHPSDITKWCNLALASGLTRAQMRFLRLVVMPLVGKDGIFRSGGHARLAARWRRVGIRGTCSERMVGKMLAAFAARGLLVQTTHSAPGRPAEYRACLPTASWVTTRARGIISRHLHRTYVKEWAEQMVAVAAPVRLVS
jgi:hypothetical protein